MLSIITTQWHPLLNGLWNTILCSLIALVGSLIIGTFFALLEISKYRIVRLIGSIYVEVFRNIPLLVIAMGFFLIVPMYIAKINGFTAGTIGLTLYTSAFIAETVRAGINSVGGGQLEGALANGLTKWQALRLIILQQAIKNMMPALVSQFISLVKDTSLATIIVLPELMYHAQIIYGQNTNYIIPMFVALAVLYFIVCYSLSLLARYLDHHLA